MKMKTRMRMKGRVMKQKQSKPLGRGNMDSSYRRSALDTYRTEEALHHETELKHNKPQTGVLLQSLEDCIKWRKVIAMRDRDRGFSNVRHGAR